MVRGAEHAHAAFGTGFSWLRSRPSCVIFVLKLY